ncbi:MAG TPA: chemotaxis protein CheW [Candidatus Acidoferrales bacterium]
MKIAGAEATKARRARSSEAVILFSIANQTFAIAADAVQEIRSTDSLGGAAIEIEQADVPKVRHLVERAKRTYYVVSGCAHFGLKVTRPTLVLILRQIRAAVLVDAIERMADITKLHALPRGFEGDERKWYRGLAYLEDRVIPVIHPAGFLTAEEFARLDQAAAESGAAAQLEGAAR